MSFITTDYSKLDENDNFKPLPTGEYEVVIRQAMERATPNGAESLQLDLVVRNDLKSVPALAETNGKFANRHIFMDNWKRKATHQYDVEGFQYILKAVGVPEGTPVNSVDDFTRLIEGKTALVYVKKEVDDYRTTDVDDPVYENTVAPWGFKSSNFTNVNHVFEGNQPQAQPQTFAPEGDDFPF